LVLLSMGLKRCRILCWSKLLKMNNAATLLLLVMASALVGLTGCGTTDLGLERTTNLGIRYSVKSNITKFNVDNVTLDFYYGNDGGHIGKIGDYTEFVCFALYFCDGQYSDEISASGIGIYFDDYRNIENHYYIKEISYDEFYSGEYLVTYPFMWTPKFNHREAITVPTEAFARESGRFAFQIVAVNRYTGNSGNDSGYYAYGLSYVSVVYTYIDEQTVLLSKPGDPGSG